MYKKARSGEIKEFTGIDSPYEVPENPEIHLRGDHLSPEELADAVITYLRKNNYILDV
jgi:adenylylsulfate kinase-like enzyme